MSAVEQLRAAADRLENLAQSATSGPWGRAGVDGMGFAVHRGEHGTVALYASSGDAAYIAAMSPEVGGALAAWLRAEADAHVSVTDDFRCCRMAPALALARAILGETP